MCDCDGTCEKEVRTTCCSRIAPECEVAVVVHNGEQGDDVICLLGFGCAADAAHYMAKLKARFG